MKKQQDLRLFLITRFLIVLVAVGVAEMALNALYNDFIYPVLDQAYGFKELMEGANLRDTVTAVLSGLLFLLVKQFGGLLPANAAAFLAREVRNPMRKDLVEHFLERTAHMTEAQKKVYMLTFFLVMIFILYFWVLPYVIGAVYFGIVVSRKMNEIEELELEKQRQYERQRNLLLSDVAHDLKTPMTTVAGYARALADDAVPSERREEYLEHIYGKTMQMSELLNLLFTYVKLDSDGFQLNREEADLCELVRKAAAEQYDDLEAHDMELFLDLPEEPVTLSVDVLQVGRVLANLIGNVIRHNPDGTALFLELRRQGGMACLLVGDSGVEIPPELAERIFDPFVQGDASRSGGSGSGLGLGIAKKIAEMHGGTITLEQSPRPGMTKAFVIRLPETE